MLHEVAAGIVGDDGVRDAVGIELERGQGRTLVPRAGLVHEDVDRHAGIVGHVDRRQSRSPIHRGEPAGVAMGQYVDGAALQTMQVAEDLRAVDADGVAALHIFLGDAAGLRVGEGRALGLRHRAELGGDPVESPTQVDRGRPRRGERRHSPVEPGFGGIRPQAEGEPVGGRDADQRRSANHHGADRHRGVVQGRQRLQLEGEGQAGLVDHRHGGAILGGEDGAVGLAVDLHGADPDAGGAEAARPLRRTAFTSECPR